MNVFDDIVAYINFLRSLGYSVSLSCFSNRFEPYTRLLLGYEIHVHAVCSYLKFYPETVGRCQANKRRLEKRSFDEPYYGCCWAGVEEYVLPVKYNGNFLMCINISGYRGTLARSQERMREAERLCDGRFPELYLQLSELPPEKNSVMSFARPLEYMIIELYRLCSELKRSSAPVCDAYTDASRFINDNFMLGITAVDVARALNYSPSYLRHIFKRECGFTVGERINEVRLEYAKALLENTKLSVTDVALSSGFCNSNYFSTVFKKRYGMSPKNSKVGHDR